MAKTKLCVDLNGICNEMCRKLNYHVSNVEMISSSSMFALFCFVFSYAFLGVCFGFASFSLFRFDINVARTTEIRRKKKSTQHTKLTSALELSDKNTDERHRQNTHSIRQYQIYHFAFAE